MALLGSDRPRQAQQHPGQHESQNVYLKAPPQLRVRDGLGEYGVVRQISIVLDNVLQISITVTGHTLRHPSCMRCSQLALGQTADSGHLALCGLLKRVGVETCLQIGMRFPPNIGKVHNLSPMLQ